MLTEIEHAAQWWASQLTKVTEQQVADFKQALIIELSTRYAGHWFADDAQRGCAYRCISYDHRMDSTLIRAAATAQLSNHLETALNKARWHSMFVNPGLVKVQNTKNIATSPTIVYPTSTQVPPSSSTKVVTLTPCQTPRRSSVQPVPRTVTFSAPVITVTPVDETPVAGKTVSINGDTFTLIPPSLPPKKSALKGHHRSQSTSPVAQPLSVRFMSNAAMNPAAATFVPKTQSPPPAQVLKPASPPPASTTAPSSPPTGSTLPPPRDTSPKAVHHSSRSVDLNSAIFADLTLTAKPSARSTPVPTVTVTPAPPGTPAPINENDRLSALPPPTVFAHMTRLNKPTHHASHSMFSFPHGLSTLNTATANNWSPTQPLSSPSIPSPTSLSLPSRLVSHHRGLSASLLPSALLVR